jgi:multidrug efflux pump subunit AcrB
MSPHLSSKGPIGWMVRNPVVANLLMLIFLAGGFLSAFHIRQEVFPEFDPDTVQVRVRYPGASPEEIETGVLRAAEEAVRGVRQVTKVTSTAREGSGTITAEYEKGADRMEIYQEVQQAIDRITTLPEDAEEPEIGVFDRRRDVFEFTLYGKADEWSLRQIAESVRERLLQRSSITDVQIEDARAFEIHVTPSREALRTYGLTLGRIAEIISASSVEIPAGGVKTLQGEVLVRFDERRDYAEEFRRIPVITTPEGATLTLGDIAEVTEGFEDVDSAYTYNGLPAIGIEIFRVGDQRPADVAAAARAAMEEIIPTLPNGIHCVVQDDRSIDFHDRLDLLIRNAGFGLLLVFVLLGIFLELRLAFWVTLGIPVAFLGSFLLLPSADISLNMISMFAFIIALGIVVDDAIIVGESVYGWRERGHSPREAAIRGSHRMAVPVAFSILTNIAAFIPIMFIPGWMGKIWYAIPIVVSAVFIISWIESVFILPSHLASLAEKPRFAIVRWIDARQQKVSDLLRRGIEKIYAPILSTCLRYRYATLGAGIAILLVTLAYAMSGRMGWTLMPTVESDEANASATLPFGTPLAQAERAREVLEAAAWRVVEENGGEALATGIFSSIEGNEVRTRVYLKPPEERPITTTRFTDLWREATPRVPGATSTRFESDRGGPGGGPAITVEVSHPDIATLEAAAVALGNRLRAIPNVSDVNDGFNLGKEQLNFQLTAEGRSLGLTSGEVARQVRHAFYGAEAIRQMRGHSEVRVLVRMEENQRRSEYDIEQLMLRTPDGATVPLRQVASVERGRAFTSIERRDGRRILTVTGHCTPREKANQVIETIQSDIMPALQADFPGLSYTFEGRQAEMRDSMAALGKNYLYALFGIYFLLAIPFRSYIQPFIVMTAIPFGIVGAVLGHLVMGYSLSVISVMGIIALSGVVINDSLVMVDYANERVRAGHGAFRAMLEAGIRRFRPILLTTLTTFGGLAPMIFETSRQARFMIPMAISLGYGLLFATAITLVIVPSLYLINEDIVRLLKKVFGREVEDGDQAAGLQDTPAAVGAKRDNPDGEILS